MSGRRAVRPRAARCYTMPRSPAMPDEGWFDPDRWHGRVTVERQPGGRGTDRVPPRSTTRRWVLRHYRRGGAVARVLDDRYLYTGADRTRAFREWRLLRELAALGPAGAETGRCTLPARRTLLSRGPADRGAALAHDARAGARRGATADAALVRHRTLHRQVPCARRSTRRPERAQHRARRRHARSICSISTGGGSWRAAPGRQPCWRDSSARSSR